MVDLKPAAPADIRGEFQPIATSLPGVQICELMPRLAERMNRLALIRTVVGSDGRHSSFQCVTGRRFASQPSGGWPCFEAVVSRLQGAVHPAVPPGFDLFMKMAHLPYNHPGAGFLGASHQPFQPQGESKDSMTLNGITADRLSDRRRLLTTFDQYRRFVERQYDRSSLDPFTEQALNVLTSSRLADALDLTKEDPAIRASYGQDDPAALPYSSKGYQAIMSKFLLARRLVQAGARCVSATFADFDWHGGNFTNGRKVTPLLDQGLAALVDDLYRHGLENDVTVVVWGEFGRTPKINSNAGRDHWSKNTFALLAGGGMPAGQVIGATSRYAEEPIDRAGPLPGNLCHAVSQSRYRRQPRHNYRSQRPSTIPARPGIPATAGAGIERAWTGIVACIFPHIRIPCVEQEGRGRGTSTTRVGTNANLYTAQWRMLCHFQLQPSAMSAMPKPSFVSI